MTRWNLAAPQRWAQMHRRARESAMRDGFRVNVVSRTWEYQRRGALHVHVVLGVGSARELAGAHAYVAHLTRLRDRHDFGFVDRGRRTGGRRSLEVVPAQRAARYVAKYLSPLDASGKPTLSATVTRRDVPPHVLYVSRELTRRTGVTMRELRRRRRCHMMGVDPVTGELLRSRSQCDGGRDQAREDVRLLMLHGAPPGL
jgi:hypothetical protein